MAYDWSTSVCEEKGTEVRRSTTYGTKLPAVAIRFERNNGGTIHGLTERDALILAEQLIHAVSGGPR